MRFSLRRPAFVLAAALVMISCGATAEQETADNVEESTTSPPSDGIDGNNGAAPDAVSLADQEAGYGPGSLAVLAGMYAQRADDVEGNWFRGPALPVELPEVCGFPEPLALQGYTLVRPVDASGLRSDVISVEVRVYETAEQAETLVSLTNGDSAQDCDLAVLELALFTTFPGVSYDFGDGTGTPAPVPDGLPPGRAAESRSYDFEVLFGTVPEPLIQRSTVVADGTLVVSFSASATPDEVAALEAETVQALFGESTPTAIDLPGLDDLIDNVRRSVLADEDLPAFFDPSHAMVLGGPDDPSECVTAAEPVATATGPFWVSVSPGAGVSEVSQKFRIYRDQEAAAAAFEQVTATGVRCFPTELNLPPEFELAGSTAETVEIDGHRITYIEIDYVQTVGGQRFDVEAKTAVTRTGQTILSTQFFGLAGDSPNLAELVATAASKGATDGN